jgi:hypothetical protein
LTEQDVSERESNPPEAAVEEKIANVSEFRAKLLEWNKTYDPKAREWLNQNLRAVRQVVIEAGCFRTVTIAPPPAVDGLVMNKSIYFR